jgi:hypothetical protein
MIKTGFVTALLLRGGLIVPKKKVGVVRIYSQGGSDKAMHKIETIPPLLVCIGKYMAKQ